VPGVYAIGDCAQHRTPPPGRKAVEQVWYTGRMHGETLALTLTGKRPPYAPGHWFNSAKFLDIEYQTYGQVGNTLGRTKLPSTGNTPRQEIPAGQLPPARPADPRLQRFRHPAPPRGVRPLADGKAAGRIRDEVTCARQTSTPSFTGGTKKKSPTPSRGTGNGSNKQTHH
jgi:NADPH-dependent 2,4-dienoyl-CoA reductase/sulfur reductase-like enzyme